MKAHVLVVDDDATARTVLDDVLRTAGFEVALARNGAEALERIECESFDVCITDLRMPGMSGIELLGQLGEQSPETLGIIITAHGAMETAIAALRAGAADYILKPFLADDVRTKVRRLVDSRSQAQEVRNLRLLVNRSHRLVGESSAMRSTKELIEKVAATRSKVLITGESGTGKELVARAIHEAGPGSGEPFVPINCAAISETLLESELFGHVRGAFTGAVAHKEGLLRTAGEGTLFLDEIGDMALSVQAKLLRAIENREIQPLGSVRRIPLHARIVAASNKDLKQEIAAGDFREDLFYRLAVVEIRVPPLRARREDIPLLAAHFVERYNRELGRSFEGISEEASQLLTGYDWKGNVRELENVIERAMIIAAGPKIDVADLPEAVQEAAPLDPESLWDLRQATRRFEISHIHKVLARCGGDKPQAAGVLGMSLSSLYRKLEEADAQAAG